MMKRKAQGMVEYVFLVSLIAIVVIVALIIFGAELKAIYDGIVNDISNI